MDVQRSSPTIDHQPGLNRDCPEKRLYTDLPQARSLRSQRSVDCIMAKIASLYELSMLKRSAEQSPGAA
jgi:hypothetical protein